MTACFAYTRVSTLKQGEGVSLDAQRDAIAAYADRSGLRILDWFEEKETAAKSGRPVFNDMLKRLKRKEAAGLIMHKIDRSARNLRDWAAIHELADAGIGVYFATETLDFASRGGRLTADIQAVIAADYIRNLREETIKGIQGRLKQGLYPFRAPIGYLDQGGGKPKIPDPKTAHLIHELFELYATGQHTYDTLREEITRQGLRGRGGGTISICGIETILKNPFYTGLIEIKRTGQTYKGIHEPLIDMALFERVQAVREGRNGQITTKHRHLFRRLFRCAYCGGPMVPEKQKGHVYYRCKLKPCPTKTVREELLDAAIRQSLADLAIRKEALEKEAPAKDDTETITKLADTRQTLDLQIADENRRLDRLSDLLIDEAIDQDTYRAKTSATRRRLLALEQERAKLPDPAKIRTAEQDLAELHKSLVLSYDLAKPDEKRQIVELVWPNRQVRGRYVELEPCDWLEERRIDPSVLYGAPERGHGRKLGQLMHIVRGVLGHRRITPPGVKKG